MKTINYRLAANQAIGKFFGTLHELSEDKYFIEVPLTLEIGDLEAAIGLFGELKRAALITVGEDVFPSYESFKNEILNNAEAVYIGHIKAEEFAKYLM